MAHECAGPWRGGDGDWADLIGYPPILSVSRQKNGGSHLRVPSRVLFSDRSSLTAGIRFRLTGPVRPVTGRNRSNVNLNSNFTVVAVPTGIPAGYTGIPAGLAGIPAGFVLRLTAVYRPVTPVYRPVWPVYRLFRVFFRRLKN